MLDFQVSQFPFRFGLAEGVEPHQVQPGTLLTADNVVWKKAGQLGKRLGTTAISTNVVGGGNLASVSRLFTRGSELCATDGTSLYAYSSTMAAWKTIGKIPNVGLTWSTLLDTLSGVRASDLAVSTGGLIVSAWITGDASETAGTGALFVQVLDGTTRAPVILPTSLSASGNVRLRVLTIGAIAIVLATNSTNVVAYTIDLSSLVVSAGTNLRTDRSGSLFDACVIGTNFVILYAKAASIDLYSYNTSLAQQATAVVEATAGGNSGGLDGAAGEVLYVVHTNTANVRVAIHTANTLAQTVAPATVEALAGGAIRYATVARYNSTTGLIAYSTAVAGGPGKMVTHSIPSTGTFSTTSERGTWGVQLASRPFMLGGACYVFATDYPDALGSSTSAFPGINTTLLGVDISTKGAAAAYVPHRYVGMTEILVGGGTPLGQLANVSAVSATALAVCLPFQATAPQGTAVWRCGVRMVTATVGASLPADMWRTCACTEAYISGGVLSAYDGARAFDYGYPRPPINSTLTAAGAAGLLAAGTYLYAWSREYRSAAAMLHRSSTVTASVAASATNTITGTLHSVNIGNKQDLASGFGTSAAVSEQIATYRSTVNVSNYQRLTFDPTYNVIAVTGTAQTQAFTDGRADSGIDGAFTTLASRPALYTSGGILDDYAPVANVTMCLHVDRLWVLAGDQKTWWYSKAFQDDLGVAPGFHPRLLISFAETQTAMASMDDKAIFFSATSIKYMLGTGPAPSGLNSDFQTPTTIQTDVGCTNPRSVVGTPDGVMFLSARGIYLLDRGLNLTWIGRPIKDTLASYPNITSAVLVAKRNQVRFTANAADGATGVVLVFDYVEKQWSVSRYTVGGAFGLYSAPIYDACMWNGEWTFASTSGSVYQESSATYLDAGAWVPMTLETAWISGPQSSLSPSAGPLKFQSVRSFGLNGTSHTDHDLTVQVGFDSNTTYQQTATFLGTSAVTSVGNLEECTVTIGTRRKCGSIRFKITDATPTTGTVGVGQGPSFDMMAIEVGNKRGLASTPATKRA